jgi:hypothetical protein
VVAIQKQREFGMATGPEGLANGGVGTVFEWNFNGSPNFAF